MTKYDTGAPMEEIAGFSWYVDLEADTMYQWNGQQWQLHSVQGEEVSQ